MATSWQDWIFELLLAEGIELVCYVPDAGHSQVIASARAVPEITALPLTNEAEGVALLAGYHLGGKKGVFLMQSSGVGNCINAFSLLSLARFPFFTLVSMRGEFGEQNSWQYPMGQATPTCLSAMGILTLRAERPEEVAETLTAGLNMTFRAGEAVAVLLGQRLIGAKAF